MVGVEKKNVDERKKFDLFSPQLSIFQQDTSHLSSLSFTHIYIRALLLKH